jgi:hypothetical protein
VSVTLYIRKPVSQFTTNASGTLLIGSALPGTRNLRLSWRYYQQPILCWAGIMAAILPTAEPEPEVRPLFALSFNLARNYPL